MPSLKPIQDHVIRAINEGPDVLDPSLFEDPADRVFRAFQLHATTINRARLMTLEATFPEVRTEIGDEAFRQACNAYLETAEARACDLNSLSHGFAEFLNK